MSYEFLIESFYFDYTGYYGYFNLNLNLNLNPNFNLNLNLNLNNNPKPITKQPNNQTTKQLNN